MLILNRYLKGEMYYGNNDGSKGWTDWCTCQRLE